MIGMGIHIGLAMGAIASYFLCEEGKISKATRKKSLIMIGLAFLAYWIFYDVRHNSTLEICLQVVTAIVVGGIFLWYFSERDRGWSLRTLMLVIFLVAVFLIYLALHQAVPGINDLAGYARHVTLEIKK